MLTGTPAITPAMVLAAAAAVTDLAHGTIIVGTLVRVCAWVAARVDPGRSGSSTSSNIVTVRVVRVMDAAARVMRQVLPLMSRTTRMKARVTRAVVQAMAVAARAMAVVLLVREILHHPIVRAGAGVSETPGT
jgi:hypothetical protein